MGREVWYPREKVREGVRPTSQNHYPIQAQNPRFSLPYLWPDETFGTLFKNWSLNQYPVSDLPFDENPIYDQNG